MNRLVPAVLLLIVLAGCGGNPMDPTATTTTEPVTYPAGLSESGIRDAYELAGIHRAVLDGQSFHQERHTKIVRVDDGTMLVNQSIRGTWEANRSWFGIHYQLDIGPSGIYGARNGSISYYANGSIVALHQEVPAEDYETSRVAMGQNGAPIPPEAFGTPLFGTPAGNRLVASRYQSLEAVSVTSTETGLRIEADSANTSQIEFGNLPVENVSEVSFVANLTAEGLVKSYDLEVTGDLNGTRVTARETVTFSEIGSANVTEPPWFQSAVDS